MRILFALLVCVAGYTSARAETLTGVVLAEDGRPAAGATIAVAAVFQSPPLRLAVAADEQGAFGIDLSSMADPTRYALAVRWRGQGVDLTEGVDSAGKPASLTGQKLPPQIIRLRTQGRLSGKLLRAEDGGPIVGAKLFVDTGEVWETDEQGAFDAIGLPMTDHSLIPVAPGRVRQYILFDTTLAPTAELEIRLPRGAVMRGRVLNEQGEPIPGANLTRASSGTALTLNGWDQRCQPDGSFEYGGLSAERLFYSLIAQAPGYREGAISSAVDAPTDVIERTVRLSKDSALGSGAATVAAAADEKADAASTKLPRRTIVGTVMDDAGAPLSSAVVRWGTFLWDPSVKSTTTDASGKYSLAEAPGEAGAILVVADGLAPQFVPAGAEAKQVDVRLSPGQTVRGVVRDTAGEPVAGVQVIPSVHCFETGLCNPIWLDERSTRTDDRGEFQIAAIPEMVSFDLLKNGYSEQRGVTLAGGGGQNEIKLTAAGALRGQVVDAAGKPVRNFKIRVLIPRDLKPGEPAGGYYAGYDWYGISYTRDDGVFVLSGINADTWMRLIVTSPGVGLAIIDRARSESLDRLSGPERLTVQLKPFVPLRVKVVDGASQQPIANGQVSLLEDEPGFPQGFQWGHDDLWATRTRTNADGMAEFSEPGCDGGTILIRAPGFARRRIDEVTADRPWTVSLEPAATLRGDVRFNGRPLADGFVRLTSSAKDSMSANLDETEGKFEFDQLPAGEYELTIPDGRGQSLHPQKKFKLEPGQTRTETITVPH